jgi:[ribosomal protein S5]-alanine N-acetyltransferase
MREVPKNVHLQGESVLLRDLLPEDITPAYVEWMNDPEVVQFTESRFVRHTHQSICEFVEECRVNPAVLLLGIFDNATKLHVGNIKLGPVEWHHLLGDIGIIVGRKQFWGRGIASQAIVLVRDFAFARVGLHKLTAGCYANNAGSAKAFAKAGFVEEARLKKQFLHNNEWVDAFQLGCIAAEHR